MLRSIQCLGVSLVLGGLGCHRALLEDGVPEGGYWCGTSSENHHELESRTPTILNDPNFERCSDMPSLGQLELSQEHAAELAKTLYMRAQELEASGDPVCRLALLEQAYYLVPGKHGFALLVGEAAFDTGDCEKASLFLKHFLAYADPQAQPDKWARAQRLLVQIETLGCDPPPGSSVGTIEADRARAAD